MTEETKTIRLNKFLALHTGVSRREADIMIEKGRVKINGQTAQLGAHLKPGDEITLDSKPVSSDTKKLYLALNKPAGFVCSRRAQGDAPTIYSLLPKNLHSLKPVGRLDKDSSGVLLLTNDGDFAHTMTHPSFHKQKQYEVSVDRELEPLHQQMINDFGIQLEDGPSKLQLTRLSDSNRRDWLVEMHEGRNRQIRRTFSALGYTVTRLHRTHFGKYALGDIKPGEWQDIDISPGA